MPAYEVPGFSYSAMSQGDIVQFTAVVINDQGNAVEAGDDVIIDGVAQMPAATASPEVIRIMQKGITIARAGDTIVAGNLVEVSDSAGAFEARSSGAIVGRALTGAGAGEHFALLLY